MDKKKRTRWGLEKGNIDLKKRPVVKNKDGSISTVRSIGINARGKEVLIPTVVGKKVVSNAEAIKEFGKTGKHLGKFRTPQQSDQYARALHVMQDKMYSKKKKH